MNVRHLNQIELAQRWAISQRTLERWRFQKVGPNYLKLGGRVVYRLTDIEAFEEDAVRFMNNDTQCPTNSQKNAYSRMNMSSMRLALD
jgi:hypothetical protein